MTFYAISYIYVLRHFQLWWRDIWTKSDVQKRFCKKKRFKRNRKKKLQNKANKISRTKIIVAIYVIRISKAKQNYSRGNELYVSSVHKMIVQMVSSVTNSPFLYFFHRKTKLSKLITGIIIIAIVAVYC